MKKRGSFKGSLTSNRFFLRSNRILQESHVPRMNQHHKKQVEKSSLFKPKSTRWAVLADRYKTYSFGQTTCTHLIVLVKPHLPTSITYILLAKAHIPSSISYILLVNLMFPYQSFQEPENWVDKSGEITLHSLPETNSSPLKMDGWNTSFLLGWPIFRGELGKWFYING